jgi:stage II sporulation protein AA (anti-sigma F factor antagonist)
MGVDLEVKIKVKAVGDVLLIYLDGEIDHHTTCIIREDIDEYLGKLNIRKIVFNFNSVTFMDSSGVGMILGRYRKVNKIGGKVAVTNLNQKVKRIFEISGLFNFIQQYENEKEAIEKM